LLQGRFDGGDVIAIVLGVVVAAVLLRLVSMQRETGHVARLASV
jgi:hypothetical protein